MPGIRIQRKLQQRTIRWLLLLVLVANILLASCNIQRRTTPTATSEPAASPKPSATEPVTPATETPYPGVGVQSTIQPGAYPNSAYPGTDNSYPAAGAQPYPSPSSQATTIQNGYPAPGGATSSPTATSSDAVSNATTTATSPPTATAQLGPTPTPSITFTPTITPTATPSGPTATPRPELQATDPLKVRLASGKVQFVEFFAYWCGSCRAMAPIIHRLEARYYQQVNFVYLDIDDPATTGFRQALFFRQEPEFYLLDEDGKVLKKWSGYAVEEEIEAAIQAALQ